MAGSRKTCAKSLQTLELLVCAVTVVVVMGGVRGQAPCSLDDISVMDGFEIEKFLGQWFEIEWIAPTYQDNGNSWINYYHFYRADEYGVVTGYYSGKDPNTGQCFLGGLVNLKTSVHPAKMKQYTENNKLLIDYWVLETNYTSYAVVYSCVHRASDADITCRTARSWLWSRTKTLPESVKISARETFNNLCMNSTLLYVTNFAGEDCNPAAAPGSLASTIMNGNHNMFCWILTWTLMIFLNMHLS